MCIVLEDKWKNIYIIFHLFLTFISNAKIKLQTVFLLYNKKLVYKKSPIFMCRIIYYIRKEINLLTLYIISFYCLTLKTNWKRKINVYVYLIITYFMCYVHICFPKRVKNFFIFIFITQFGNIQMYELMLVYITT